MQASAEVVVAESVESLILGIDWITANQCQWDFGRGLIKIHDNVLRLHSRPRQGRVRRIYAERDSIIPAGHQGDISVNITWPDLHPARSDLAVSPKPFQNGVISARTLLGGSALQSAVRVMNTSNEDYVISRGTYIGPAEEVEICSEVGESSGLNEDINVVDAATCLKMESQPESESSITHVQPVIQSLPEDLSDDQKEEAPKFIEKHADLFSKSEFDIGRTPLVQHVIDTGHHRPFKQPLRRHPLSQLPIIDEHVEQMLSNDVIEPAASPWASNVVLVRRKDNSFRFCIDYRALNLRTCQDSYPLPRIDSCLDSLGGATLFSTLDLRSGYWQVPMQPESAEKTAFVTRKGVWKFKVMPFGLTNAPAVFQRLMDAVLAGLAWEVCLVYPDDVVVFSNTFERHIERLSLVFERLRKANLKLKPEKCRLFQRKIQFLGHVVSAAGVEPDPKKAQAVVEWPTPRSLTEVRAFVALASYYRRHIAKFADIARPLHELTQKGRAFVWTDKQQKAFVKLKECLVNAPVLATPIDGGRYTLDTDASQVALGCVLQQEQDGQLRVIAYASRALQPPEKSYSTTRKELLAIVYGLKYFRQFLLGTEFELRTDHAALTSLLRTPEPVGQQARWLDLIGEYRFKIVHRPGSQHRNSDALSRRPHEVDKRLKIEAEESLGSETEAVDETLKEHRDGDLSEPPGEAITSEGTDEMISETQCTVISIHQTTSTTEVSECPSDGNIAEVGVPSGRRFVCQGLLSEECEPYPPDGEPPLCNEEKELCCIQQRLSSVELDTGLAVESVTVVGLPSGADFIRQGQLPGDLVELSPVEEVARAGSIAGVGVPSGRSFVCQGLLFEECEPHPPDGEPPLCNDEEELCCIQQQPSSVELDTGLAVGSVTVVGLPSGADFIRQGQLPGDLVELSPVEEVASVRSIAEVGVPSGSSCIPQGLLPFESVEHPPVADSYRDLVMENDGDVNMDKVESDDAMMLSRLKSLL